MCAQPSSVSPPRPPAKSNTLKILLIVGIVGVCCSCLACGGILGLMMMSPSATPVAVPETVAPVGVPAGAAPEVPDGPDDFIYHAANGAQFIPELKVLGGKQVTLAGTWREDHQGFLLVLGADASYRCEAGGSAGRSAAGSVESGTWSLVEGKIHLVPTRLTLHAVNGLRQITEEQPVGPPRNLTAEGLALEYAPYDNPGAPARKIDGLAIEGETPSWDYTVTGKWKFTLRRAR